MVDVKMPNGMIIRNVPQGTPKEVLLQKMQTYETVKSISSKELEVLRNNLDNPDIVGKIQKKYGVSVDSIKKTFPKQFLDTKETGRASSLDSEENISGVEKGVGFVVKSLAEGAAGLTDIPTMLYKELVSRQLGVPSDLLDVVMKTKLGGALPSEIVGSAIDPKNQYEPKDKLERYIETGLQMLGGGAKPDLSTLGSTIGLQTAKEMDGGALSQIAGAVLGGAAGGKIQSSLLQSNANLQKNLLTKGEKALTKALDKNAIVDDLLKSPQVAKRVERSLERTPDAYQAGVSTVKKLEGDLLKSVKPVQKGLKAKTGAEVISNIMDLERSNATKPLYEKAFLENGKYIRPKGVNTAKAQLFLENANPDYAAFKSLSLRDTRNINKLDKGFENSLAMLNDVKSRITKSAIKTADAQKQASLFQLADEIDNIIQNGTPENKLKILEQATSKYKELSQKIDSIFGKKGAGKLGALLKFDEMDAQSSEKILPQLKTIFEEQPENIKKYKNIFERYGQNHKWASGFSAYTKNLVDNLKETETLYSKINETKRVKSAFMSALPDKYLGKFNEIMKLGSNLEELKNKALLGKAYKEGLTKEDFVDLAQAFGKGQKGRGYADLVSSYFNRFRGLHDIDKEIVSIVFDSTKNESFLKKYNTIKTLPEKKNFVIKYITENPSAKVGGISTAITNKQSEQ